MSPALGTRPAPGRDRDRPRGGMEAPLTGGGSFHVTSSSSPGGEECQDRTVLSSLAKPPREQPVLKLPPWMCYVCYINVYYKIIYYILI